MIFNADSRWREVALPARDWVVVVDGDRAGTAVLRQLTAIPYRYRPALPWWWWMGQAIEQEPAVEAAASGPEYGDALTVFAILGSCKNRQAVEVGRESAYGPAY